MEEGRQFGPMRICGLSRAVEKDIYRCWDAVTPQGQPRLGFGVIAVGIRCQPVLGCDGKRSCF